MATPNKLTSKQYFNSMVRSSEHLIKIVDNNKMSALNIMFFDYLVYALHAKNNTLDLNSMDYPLITAKNVTDRFGLGKSTGTAIFQQLESAGLITERTSYTTLDYDYRAKYLTLTPQGLALAESMLEFAGLKEMGTDNA